VKKNLITVIILISILSFPVFLYSSQIDDITTKINEDGVVSINEKWVFSANNQRFNVLKLQSINYKDSIVSISDPRPWQKEQFIQNKNALASYTTIINLSETGDYGIFLPLGKRGAKLFINNRQIAQTTTFDHNDIPPNNFTRPQIVKIDSSVLRTGINILQIETGSLDGWGGFMSHVGIGRWDDIKAYWVKFISFYSALMFISLFLCIYYLFFFYYRPVDKYYLFYSLLSLFFSMWVIGFSGLCLYIINHYFFFIICTYIGAMAFCIYLLLFLENFLNTRNKVVSNIFITIFSLFIISLLAEYLLTGSIFYFNKYTYNLFMLVSFLLLFYFLHINIIAIKNQNPFSKRILIGIVITFCAVVYSIFVFLSIIYTRPLIIEGFFAMTLVFASVLASRFSQVHTDLEKAHGDLLVLDKLKDDFMATTSHELRTPLHGIIGLSETIIQRQDLPVATHYENVKLINSSARRLNYLVDDILDFTKMRSGRAELFFKTIHTRELLSGLTSLALGMAYEKNITVRAELPDTLPNIIADRHRVEQVILNLLANAVKFTDGGEVVVSAREVEDGVEISVTDTGCGINPDYLERIFDPYTQEASADTRSKQGTGLGLSIARYLVELHGGRISARSESGAGSTFTVVFPFEPPEEVQAVTGKRMEGILSGHIPQQAEEIQSTGTAVAHPDGKETLQQQRKETTRSARILVVDDDPVNLRIVESMLEGEGYRVLMAENGKDALELMSREHVDLVLLDVMMPDKSGYEVAMDMRNMKGREFIPIIMVTARNRIEDMVKGFIFGGNDYVSKPFNGRELLLRVENQLVIKQMIDLERSLKKEDKKEQTRLIDRSGDLRDVVLKLQEWERIISEDMKVAEVFHRRLMMEEVLHPSIEFGVHYDPLLTIGGDIFSVSEYRPGRVRVFLADATGHGIKASLNTVTILSEYNLVREKANSPVEVIQYLNEQFCGELIGYKIVFTCVVAEIYVDEGLVKFASAGHPLQYLVHADGKTVELKPKGPIIGLRSGLQFNEQVVDMPAGSSLFMYTDGLLDIGFERANKKDHRDYRDEAFLCSVLARHADSKPEELLDSVLTGMKAKQRQRRRNTDDDITMIALKRNK